MLEVGKTYRVVTTDGSTPTSYGGLTVLEVNFPLVKFERYRDEPIYMNVASLYFISAEEVSGADPILEVDPEFVVSVMRGRGSR